MSPCLSTIQAATPKCPGEHTNMNTLAGLAKYIPCVRPMRALLLLARPAGKSGARIIVVR
jgi:hypothetical protein